MPGHAFSACGIPRTWTKFGSEAILVSGTAAGLSIPLIDDAAAFLLPRVRVTPVERSGPLSDCLGVETFLKLEFLQITGSFKIRGALYRLELARRDGIRELATCSAGNHGKAVAYAAAKAGMRAVIFVPSSVDESKFRAMVALGADVRRSEFPGFDDTEAWARECARHEELLFLSAFDDYAVMAGNGGTLAMETASALPQVRNWIVPVGGGGLSAGLAFWVKAVRPEDRVIGCQLEASPALRLSLDRGSAVTRLPGVDTLAGGVEGGIGALTFPVLRDRIDGVALVGEDEVRQAMRWMLREHQYLIEPTAAVTLAACLNGRIGRPVTGETVVLVCGRNVSESTARAVLGSPDLGS